MQKALHVDDIAKIIDNCVFRNMLNGKRYVARVPNIECRVVSDLATLHNLYPVDIYNIWFVEYERLVEEEGSN